MVYKFGQIFLPFCHNARVWRTDRRTEFSSLDRVCIACSAVKTKWPYDLRDRCISGVPKGGEVEGSEQPTLIFEADPNGFNRTLLRSVG